jgi:hypothetical protein
MVQEIFRFMTIHPPQEVDSETVMKNVVNLNDATGDFIALLVEQKEAGSREGIERLVQEFLNSNDSGFIDARKKVDSRFLSFYESLVGMEEHQFHKASKRLFIKIFNIKPDEFVKDNGFIQFFIKVANSMVVATIEQDIESKVRSLLVRLTKTLGLIQKLAYLQENQEYSKTNFLSQIIVLPEGIFPLPPREQDVPDLRAAEKERRANITKNHEQLRKLSQELAAHRNAIKDVLTAFEKSAQSGFMLSEQAAHGLGDETKAVLANTGLEPTTLDVARAITLLEKQASAISNRLHANRSSMKYLVQIGNNLIPSDSLLGAMPISLRDGAADLGEPGMCPPVPPVDENDEVTVPLSHTHGEARVLGMADLMVVEQELLRYELGEIAHIENVLQSERRERKFRTATTTEQSVLTETEVIDEKTTDLTSTERFELQTESENVLNENTSTEAGLTINASYGPSVDTTANFNYTHSNAKEETKRASASFARETTTRATSKIRKRTLERRFVRTVKETEEINTHSFDNTQDGAENISGVYRFVDKIYHAQIVSYDKRFMLEFVVPEPAAFLRYAMTKQQSIGGVMPILPEPPGYCKDNKFIPLQAQDLYKDNYMYWASKYLAQDIEPPPNETHIISGVVVNQEPGKKSPVTNDIYQALELKDLEIPDGYKPVKAAVTVEAWNVADPNGGYPATLTVQIQDDLPVPIQNVGIIEVNLVDNITDKIPISVVTKNYENFSIVANIWCDRTIEKFQQWQLNTYDSIMNAYNDQKSRYDDAVATERIQAGDAQISGTNPFMNREAEKTELKKGCIALLTAQNFDTFDAMRRNVAPHGYPEIAFADANAEGRYIQFFENAFEWRNMTYIFYPYFWGKKEDWVTTSQIADTDPLYTHFLQAGAARVQVPVRPGFETSLLHYLQVGTLWYGEGTLVNADDGIADPLHLSVLDELKEQLGNQNIEGKGRLTVKKNDTRVRGDRTEFTNNDENKRIIIKGRTYIIKAIISPTEIQLTNKFMDANESDVRYSMGGKLVGEPWEVKLPTDLVKLDSSLIIN